MKSKKERLFSFLVGVDSKRDEYELNEIHQVFSWTGMGLLFANNLLMAIVLVIDQMNETISVAGIGLVIINMLSSVYLVIKLYGKGLNTTEFEELAELKRYKRNALWCSLSQGAVIGVFLYLLMGVILPLILGERVVLNGGDFIKSLVVCTFGIGLIFYLFIHFRVKKYTEK